MAALKPLILCAALTAMLSVPGKADDAVPAPAPAALPSPPVGAEVLRYVWRLEGFGGFLASLFVPGDGEGRLTTGIASDGKLQTELLITSNESKAGDFWRYGAELDTATHATVRAWSAYQFRGKSRTRDLPVAEPGAVDISSAIHALRMAPPASPTPMRIWSDGRLYPVRVIPGPRERFKQDGIDTVVRRYVLEGVDQPGERYWKGRMEIVLDDDAVRTPLEIAVRVSLASLRLRLVGGTTALGPAPIG